MILLSQNIHTRIKWGVLASLWLALVVSSRSVCPPGRFSDQVTGQCEECHVLCNHADIQGTWETCCKLCPEYNQAGILCPTSSVPTSQPPSSCPPGQYYDDVVGRCDHCNTICYLHEIQGTSDNCRIKCPTEYYGSSTDGRSASVTSVTPAASYEDSTSSTPLVLMVIALSLLVLVGLVGVARVAVLCLRHLGSCLRPRHPNTNQSDRKSGVQCSEGSEPSTSVSSFSDAVDGSGPLLQPPQNTPDAPMSAFADLLDSRRYSYNIHTS